MADSKLFKLDDGMTAETIGRAVEVFFREKKKMLAEGMTTPGLIFIQIKRTILGKNLQGWTRLQVQIFQSTPDSVTVNVGTGKWMDKAAAAGVGAIVFAPLMATAAFGAFKQQKLPQEIFDEIEYFIRTGGKSVTVSMGASVAAKANHTVVCPGCHAENAQGTKFCSSCGTPLSETCPNCHAAVSMETKFCPECGENLVKAKEKHCSNCQSILEEDTKFCPECGTKAG